MSNNTRFLLVLGIIFWAGQIYTQTLCESNPSFLTNAPQTLCLDNNGSTPVSIIISNLGAPGTYEINYPDGIDTILTDVSGVATISHLYNFDCADMPGDPIEPGDNAPFGSFGYFTRITRTDCVDEFGVANFDNIKFNVIPNPLNGFTYSDLACLSSPFNVQFTGDICNRDLVDEFFWYVDDELLGDTLNFAHNFPGPGTYEVEFAVTDHFDCDTFSISQEITITAAPSANAILQIDSTQLCSPSFQVGINNISQHADDFTWTPTSSGVSFSNQTAENPTITIDNTQAGDYTFELCADNSNCDPNCRPFTITTFEQQMIDTIPGEILCTQTLVETCAFMEFSPIPPQITWSSTDADIVGDADTLCALVQIPNADNFTITASGRDICGNEFTESITIPLFPTPEIMFTNPDSICVSNETLNLLDYINPAENIEDCSVPNCEFIPNTPGIQMFMLTDSCGGMYEMQIEVIPIGGLSQDEITVCIGQAIDLQTTIQAGTYTGNGVSGGVFQSNNVGAFEIEYTDPTSFCMGIATLTVNVEAEPIASFEFSDNACLANENIFSETTIISINNTSSTPTLSYTIEETGDIQENLNNITLPNLTPGSYTLTQVVGISPECQAIVSETFIIEPAFSPTVSIEIDTTSACDSIQIDLAVTPAIEGYVYDWSLNGQTGNSEIFSVMVERPDIADTITANLTVMTACTTVMEMIQIERPARFDVSFEILNTNDAICSGDTATLVHTSQNYDFINVIFEDGTTSNEFPETLVYSNNSDTTRLVPIIVEGFKEGCPPGVAMDTIIVYPSNTDAAFSIDYEAPVCSPFTVTLTTAVTPIEAVTQVDWGDGSTPQFIDNLGDTTYTYPNFANDTIITVTVTSQLCGDDSQSFDISIFAAPNIGVSFQAINGRCTSDTIQFIPLGDVLPTYDIDWDFGDGTFSNFLNPEKHYLNSGIYTVILTVTDTNLCQSIDSLNVEIIGYSGPELIVDAPDAICENSEFDLVILNPHNEILIDYGNGNISNELIPVPYPEPDNYNLTVTVSDLNNCQQDTSLWVNVVSPVSANIIPDMDEITIEFGASLTLDFAVNPNRAITHTWEGPGIDNPDNRQINVTPLNDTIYHLNVTDEFGCTSRDSLIVRINKDYCEGIYVPNVFSPNDDLINDLFFINTNPDLVNSIKTFQIFSRWGELIFESNDCEYNGLNCSWNGNTQNGQPVNPAVFVWRAEIEFKDGSIMICRDDVTLVK